MARNASSIPVTGLESAIAEILRDYGDVVFEASDDGTEAAAKVLVKNLAAASPHRSGKFAKGWKTTGKKYKAMRFVGNTVTVPGKGGKEVSLTNIFEYSTTRGKPFVKQTFEESVGEMAQAYVDAMKNKV